MGEFVCEVPKGNHDCYSDGEATIASLASSFIDRLLPEGGHHCCFSGEAIIVSLSAS